MNFARIQYRDSDPGWEGYPVWQTGLPTLASHPIYHVNVIKLKWEIIWTGWYPALAGYLTYLGPPSPCKQALSREYFYHNKTFWSEFFALCDLCWSTWFRLAVSRFTWFRLLRLCDVSTLVGSLLTFFFPQFWVSDCCVGQCLNNFGGLLTIFSPANLTRSTFDGVLRPV